MDSGGGVHAEMMGPMNGGWSQALLILAMLLIVAILLLSLRQRPVERNDEPGAPAGPRAAAEGGGSEDGSDDRLEVALRLLDENERRVVEALVAKGGVMLQKDIVYELGYSRVKAHRVVQSLVKRGLVTTEEYYNTNRVVLADWLRE